MGICKEKFVVQISILSSFFLKMRYTLIPIVVLLDLAPLRMLREGSGPLETPHAILKLLRTIQKTISVSLCE